MDAIVAEKSCGRINKQIIDNVAPQLQLNAAFGRSALSDCNVHTVQATRKDAAIRAHV